MSPLPLRRYRAERLLREEFQALRAQVIATVRGRLNASGVSLDAGDLEACYALAWQGLYAAVLDGQEVANPSGWLAVVTFRRAIDEHRARGRLRHSEQSQVIERRDGPSGPRGVAEERAGIEHDLAAELDDRVRLRQLFEALRVRLSPREREAATLCYLQGLSRAEAAARMGIAESRLRKLMEGRGAGRPGVAGKVGELLDTIRAGAWCEEQGSLMRGLAYGILDPAGERYRLAVAHRRDCPACRAYVVSLRGLAAVLPAPIALPWVLGGGAGAAAGAGAALAKGGGASAQAGAGTGTGSAAGTGTAAGAGMAASAGTAGAGGAGGSWFLAGGVGAKLAVGCLVTVGVGAGCVALSGQPVARRHLTHSRHIARGNGQAGSAYEAAIQPIPITGARLTAPAIASSPGSGGTSNSISSRARAARANREFGLEQSATVSGVAGKARAAAAGSRVGVSNGEPVARRAAPAAAPVARTGESAVAGGQRGGGRPAAQREFAPG
ncbi:MAG TPA: sigma-70 family RNA polymerase sigma factor [Solirubrobacteraceae bacterium]|jgi:RNA polymerase sigma factor (sigma-70 family)